MPLLWNLTNIEDCDNVCFEYKTQADLKEGETLETLVNPPDRPLRQEEREDSRQNYIDHYNPDPTDEEISAGAAEFKHKKARLALDIVKTISGFQPREAPKRPTPKLDKQADVLELTKGIMNNAGKPRP